jgi:hypothetical protein
MNKHQDITKDTNKKTARIVGILYIIGTAAGVMSVVLTQSLLNAPDLLGNVSTNQNQLIIGSLLVLIMGLALALVAVTLYKILKKQNETLALGYLVFRGALETVIYIVMVITWLFLVIVSREYLKAGTPDASQFQTLGTVLLNGNNAIGTILGIVFSLGALMLYYVFWRSKLIPRWISGWGFFAIILHLSTNFFIMFDITSSASTVTTVMNLPIGLQEMVMAVWLIVKGFNPTVIISGSAEKNK